MKNKERIIYGLIVFMLFTCVIAILFNPYTFNLIGSILTRTPLDFEKLYVIQDDWIQQGIPFYKEFFRLMDNGNLGWSWNLFLGNDFFVSKEMLYVTSDIFAYISYFVNKVIKFVPNTLFIMTLVKCYISGLSFYWLLSCLKIKFPSKLIFSSLFIATGWSLIFLEHPIFISFYCLTPLLLVSAEYILQKNKYFMLIIVAALLISTSYYLAWIMCIYLLVYWCIRYFTINKYDFKKFFILSFKTLGAFLIGVLIASVIWLPSLMNLEDTPRLMSDGLISYSTWGSTNIISILMSFFIPVTKFDNLLYHDMWYYFYQIGIYSGVLPLLLIPQYFKQDTSKKEKQMFGVLLIFTLLTLVSPFIGKIFHFTYSLRYTIIFNFTILIIAALSLDKLKKVHLPTLLITEGIILVLLALFGIILPIKNGINFNQYPEIRMLAVAAILSIIYFISLLLYKSKQKMILIIGLFAILETMFQGNQAISSYSKNEIINAQYINDTGRIETLYKKLKEMDPSFYRVNLQVKEPIDEVDSANFGMYYNIPTLKTYDSLYNYNNYNFLQYMRQYPEVNWIIDIEDPVIFENLATKYSIVSKDLDLEYYYYLGEEIILDQVTDQFRVFKHRGDYAMAKSFNGFVDQDKVLEMSQSEKTYLHEISTILTNNLAVESSLIPELTQKYSHTIRQSFDSSNYDDNHVYFDMNLNEDSIVYFSIPSSKGWTITCNGDVIKPLSVNGGFIALELKKGANEIHFNYTIPYVEFGLILSSLGIILNVFILIKESIKKKN